MRPRFTLFRKRRPEVILLRSPAMALTAMLWIALTQPGWPMGPPGLAERVSPETIAALPSSVTGGVGAPVSFVEYEAENAVSHGRVVGPDRTFGTLAAEASGRRAVSLENPGDFVEFTLAKSANALTLRYAVPDDAPDAADDGLELYALYVLPERWGTGLGHALLTQGEGTSTLQQRLKLPMRDELEKQVRARLKEAAKKQ